MYFILRYISKNKRPKWKLIIVNYQNTTSLYHLESNEKLMQKFQRQKTRNLQYLKNKNNDHENHQEKQNIKNEPALLPSEQNSQNQKQNLKESVNICIKNDEETKHQTSQLKENLTIEFSSFTELKYDENDIYYDPQNYDNLSDDNFNYFN